MAEPIPSSLSRRERQIMDIVHRLGRATAGDIRANLPDNPSYSAVRAALRLMVQRGHLKHELEWPRYVYTPTISPSVARKSALKQVVKTFFGGSHEEAMAALIDMSGAKLTDEERETLQSLIEKAKEEGR
jgi:BlaI family transcriptional regulator, penicillinase repressor